MTPRKSTSPRTIPLITLLAALLVCAPPAAESCEVPVFQYALEFWEADLYEVTVFHRGPLSGEEAQALELLRAGADHRQLCANIRLQEVDLADAPDGFSMQLWQAQRDAQLPWVVVRYPQVRRIPHYAWTGPLTVDNARSLLDSPKRQEITRRLLDREVAVWVLLESGDRRKDAAAARMLEDELKRLEGVLRFPEIEGWGPAADREDAEDDVRFSVVRVSRDDPAEQMLVRMLLLSEADLTRDYAGEPIAFPLYGRGLILYALAGPGINEWTIADAAQFVTGPCSCQVKASNPGTDLLISMDWGSKVTRTATQATPPLTGMAGFGDRAAEAEQRLAALDDTALYAAAGLSGDTGAPPTAGSMGGSPWWAVAVLVLAALMTGATVLARRRRAAWSGTGHGEAARA